MAEDKKITVCPMCAHQELVRFFTYHQPPAVEVKFKFVEGMEYYREYWRCRSCGHFISRHDIDLSGFYSGDYVTSTYRDEAGLLRHFERIIALSPADSDNAGRSARIHEFAAKHFQNGKKSGTLLDVGSGLGVFPYVMKKFGWQCTALDPDERAVKHLKKRVGVEAVLGNFMAVDNLGAFDIITFNKVLEHVKDPVAMLRRSLAFLKPGGFVYIAVPDGETASLEGQEREEFAIEHWHVFSQASLMRLVEKAGFIPKEIERLKEPSTKYTLRAFLVAAQEKVKRF